MEDSKTGQLRGLEGYIKKSQEGLITADSNNINNIRTNITAKSKKTEMWRKNNVVDVSSDKLAKSQIWKPGYG